MKHWKMGALIGAIPAILYFGYWIIFVCKKGAEGDQRFCVPVSIIEGIIATVILSLIGILVAKIIEKYHKN